MKILKFCFLLFLNYRVEAKTHNKQNSKILCEKCNVLLISIDATQAKHVHHLGYPKNTTPVLDALAKKGFSFSNAISPASWTVPTYLSVFSSMHPSEHGLTNRYEKFTAIEKIPANFAKSKPELLTIAEVFKNAGYRTGGFTGNSGVSASVGYNKGFDVYTDDIKFGGFDNSASYALKWLKETKGPSPFFMFLHGYDNHGQFSLKETYQNKFWPKEKSVRFMGTPKEQEELRELGLAGKMPSLTADEVEFWRSWYDSKISDTDQKIGSFLKEAEKTGDLNNTIIIVISDHGTEFYEHAKFDHGHTLYDELIRVPFVFSIPNQRGNKLIHQQVSTLDLLPTTIDLVGIKPSKVLKKQIKGRSLVAAFKKDGKLKSADVYSETDYRNFTHLRSLRKADGFKYIMTLETGHEELYDTNKDPGEKINIADSQKDILKKLNKQLFKHLNGLGLAATQTNSACIPVYMGQCEKQEK